MQRGTGDPDEPAGQVPHRLGEACYSACPPDIMAA